MKFLLLVFLYFQRLFFYWLMQATHNSKLVFLFGRRGLFQMGWLGLDLSNFSGSNSTVFQNLLHCLDIFTFFETFVSINISQEFLHLISSFHAKFYTNSFTNFFREYNIVKYTKKAHTCPSVSTTRQCTTGKPPKGWPLALSHSAFSDSACLWSTTWTIVSPSHTRRSTSHQ